MKRVKQVARKGVVQAVSSDVEGVEIPTTVATNNNKRKTTSRSIDGDVAVEEPRSGNLGSPISKKGKTLDTEVEAVEGGTVEHGGAVVEDTVHVEKDAVVPEDGVPARKVRQAPVNWRRHGKMVVSSDGALIK
ncbi:uncharacterized protein LOC141633920 [Silene latifolia]|uniref:uncharacterized protein LOC141633920 n=1 Tax=Silene latifolia TaxID=37657 RepID=UPI003D76E256